MTCACGHDEHGRMTMCCLRPDCPCMIANSDSQQWIKLYIDIRSVLEQVLEGAILISAGRWHEGLDTDDDLHSLVQALIDHNSEGMKNDE